MQVLKPVSITSCAFDLWFACEKALAAARQQHADDRIIVQLMQMADDAEREYWAIRRMREVSAPVSTLGVASTRSRY